MSIIENLERKKEEYNEIMKDLEEVLQEVESLDDEELDFTKGSLKTIQTIITKIKKTGHEFSKKIIKENIKKLDNKNPITRNKRLLKFKPLKAIENIEKRAINGDTENQYLLGKIYYTGTFGNYGQIVSKDYEKSYYWLYEAAAKNHLDATYLLGIMKINELDYISAISLFESNSKQYHLKSLQELLIIYKSNPKYKNKDKYMEILEKISISNF